MSIWTTVKGTITINNATHVSIKTRISEIFGEVCIDNLQQTKSQKTINHIVSFTFVGDGVDAAIHIQKFVDTIRQHDKTAIVELEASIRFL